MARLISEILRVSEPAFTHEINRLETLAGHPRIDVRLVSELASGWRELASEIGLDGQDTTAKELYFGLQKKAYEQDAILAQKLGITDQDDIEKVVQAAVKYVQSQLKERPVWVLKNSVARSQLKANPPKKTLKILGLRSIDSAIKSEPVSELIIFARKIESRTWLDSYVSQACRIKNTDFNRKPVGINIVDKKRSERMRKAGYSLGSLIYRHDETGGILIVLPAGRFACDVLFFVDSLLREANAIRRFSAFAKYLSVRPNFAQWLEVLRTKSLDYTAARIFNFGWSPVHHLLHNIALEEGEAPFEPQLDHEDVLLASHRVGPLGGHQHVVIKDNDGIVISCNMSDVIVNAANRASAENSVAAHGRRELYNELFSRYLRHDPVLEDFLRRQA